MTMSWLVRRMRDTCLVDVILSSGTLPYPINTVNKMATLDALLHIPAGWFEVIRLHWVPEVGHAAVAPWVRPDSPTHRNPFSISEY